MSIYQSDPNAAPDTDFESGTVHHLVTGNRGRLLDPRRTPVTIVEVRSDVGLCTMRIDAFEDKGARWEIPFEEIDRYQFERGSLQADASDTEEFRAAIGRLDCRLEIPCVPAERHATEARLEIEERQAESWLARHSVFLAAGGTLPDSEQRTGDRRLQKDLREYMELCEIGTTEAAFAHQFVSNPYAGEVVKGHRIVLAEMGLVPYDGKVVRDSATFEEPWDRVTRRHHLESRLGFVRALFKLLGKSHVSLFRGVSTSGPIELPRNLTFISATFSRQVAESHFEAAGPLASRLLLAQHVPVERVLMTFLETAEMNEPFREAEAVLLFEPQNLVF